MSEPSFASRQAFAPWNKPDAQPFVHYANIGKSYGDAVAVQNIDLKIYRGEFFALLGPSGCGKTTLLRLLAGFEQPEHGSLILDGQDLAGIPSHLRPVNMMFQSYALFPHLNVYDNIAFGLRQEIMNAEERQRRVRDMLALVKLEHFAQRKPHQLSGGQKQRVALARSLAKRPKILLLDEPLAALDKKLRDETRFELMHLQSQLQTTFIIVTHDREEAMVLADRMAVMDHGRIVQVGTPEEIYENPQTRHVAGFVGEVNSFAGTVSAIQGNMLSVQSGNAGLLRLESTRAAIIGESVYVALRPEKMQIDIAEPSDTSCNAVRGEVFDVGYLGDFSVYHIRLEDGTILRAASVNRVRGSSKIDWGAHVWLSWDVNAAMLLKE